MRRLVVLGILFLSGCQSVRGPLEPGTYRLAFRLGTRFFSRVEVEFAVADAGRHYHIPLLVAPFQCTTYRGS